MSKLDELRNLVAEMFKEAEDKAAIEQSIAINNSIKAVEEEQSQLVEKNAELLKSYKDLVMHTSFKDETKPTDPVAPVAPTFEEALQTFMKNNKE